VSLRQRAALVAVTSVFMGFGGFAQIRSSDYTTVVQQICRGYAAAQHALPYDTMYAQCMYARGYPMPGFSPSPIRLGTRVRCRVQGRSAAAIGKRQIEGICYYLPA
jgi:hypothetical protein